jgi:hypothetical protein
MKNLIWADRIALVWWGFLAIILMMGPIGPTVLVDPRAWHAFVILVGIPWLFLRGIDFIVTGHARHGSR